MEGLSEGLFQAFINWMYSSGEITVPSDFHDRCTKVNYMLDNDVSGVINTVLDYSINSASEAKFHIECSEETLEKLLNKWLSIINININGVPSGLQELSREYYKERWGGSSFCILRLKDWETIVVDKTSIKVPTSLWFTNGSSIYVKREDEKNYKLGSDIYYLDKEEKNKIPANKEEIIVQKPFSRWFNKYPSPYLIRKGVYKNWKGIEVLQEKSDEVLTKILPYLFVIQKGTEALMLKGDIDYDDENLKPLVAKTKEFLEKYKSEKARVPINAIAGDQSYNHLIPDLRNILTEELYRQGYRAILSGLGFVDIIQGISSTRKESVLNPKPFLAEVNSGVGGFKSVLLEVIKYITEENSSSHKKLFSDNSFINIVNSPLRINVDEIIDAIRSGYDRGICSIQSYQEVLGFDPETEKERRQKELDEGMEDLFYPHLVQNVEATPDRMSPAKPKNETNEKQGKKPGSPESKQFKNATIEVIEEPTIKEEEEENLIIESELDMNLVQGFAPVTTENYIRLRQEDPNEFDKNSFKTIVLSESQGIKAIVGKKKGKTSLSIQSYLFDRKKWTVEKAQEWIKKHRASIEEVVVANLPENLEIAPYDLRNAPKSIKKLPKDLQELWIRTFNEVLKKDGDEAKAHRISWYVVNKERNKKSKANELDKEKSKAQLELIKKQSKLLDKLNKSEESNETI